MMLNERWRRSGKDRRSNALPAAGLSRKRNYKEDSATFEN